MGDVKLVDKESSKKGKDADSKGPMKKENVAGKETKKKDRTLFSDESKEEKKEEHSEKKKEELKKPSEPSHESTSEKESKKGHKDTVSKKSASKIESKESKGKKEHGPPKEEAVTHTKKNKVNKKNKPFGTYLLVILLIAVAAVLIYRNLPTNQGVLAEVNGEKITFDEIRNVVLRVSPEQFNESLFRDVVEYKVNETLLSQLADEEGIVVNETAVNQTYKNQYVSMFESEAQLDTVLASAGFTKEEIKESIRSQIRQAMLINQLFGNISVSEEEVQTFYEENKEQIQYFYSMFMNQSVENLSDIEGELENLIIENKKNIAFQEYLTEHYNQSEIKLYEENIQKYYEIANEALQSQVNVENTTNETLSPEEEIIEEDVEDVEGTTQEEIQPANVSQEEATEEEIEENTTEENASQSEESSSQASVSPLNENTEETEPATQPEETETKTYDEESLTCFTHQGYEKSDVVIFVSEGSENYDKVQEIKEKLPDLSFKEVDINSNVFFDLTSCLEEQISYIPTFVCIADGTIYEGEPSSAAVEEAMNACS